MSVETSPKDSPDSYLVRRVSETVRADYYLSVGYMVTGIGGLFAGAATGRLEVMGLGAVAILATKIPVNLFEKNEAILRKLEGKVQGDNSMDK